MKTIMLSYEQHVRVKNIYANLRHAQVEFDRKWSEADKQLHKIAKELGLPNLGNTSWSKDYTEIQYASY